jgi:hypothetical protein
MSEEVWEHRDRDDEGGVGRDARRRAGLRRGYLRGESIDRVGPKNSSAVRDGVELSEAEVLRLVGP